MQFKTKARAVDLLGKGQIADLPTAISELWKNGYDAYADKLSAELYTSGYEDVISPFFIISDNGKGMSGNEVTNKWLVLGTDSKSRGDLPKEGKDTLWKKPRPLMGEKGIGRLSVSYLGSPMLMLTKKIGHPLQAVFFDWRTLENYNLFLDDINIPIRPILNLKSFRKDFESLKTEFLSNFLDDDLKEQKKKKSYWDDQQELYKNIIYSSENITLPAFFEEEIIEELIGDGDEIHGTKFIIFEPDEQFLILKKWVNQQNNSDDQDIETIDDIRNGLIGFCNEFKYDIEETLVETSFYINDNTGKRDFIGNNAFFSKDDFKESDHLIEGNFDEYGTFSGKIRVYREVDDNYVFRPNRIADQKTSYGKFEIKLGYVPGKGQSILSDEMFKYFDDKLLVSGGLYIYRDDLRVLPYGRPHSDFLGFEENRTRNAGVHFFSYRRMFGFIGLTRENNRALRDKAGREGFINNAAFRDLRIDLKAFFGDLAREYFSTNARKDVKQRQLDDLREEKNNVAVEKELEKEEKKKFKDVLKTTPKRLSALTDRISDAKNELHIKLNESKVVYQEIQQILRLFDSLKSEYDGLRPTKPKRFKLNSREQENFDEVLDLYEDSSSIIETAKDLIDIAYQKIEESQLIQEYENKYNQYHNFLADFAESSKRSLDNAFIRIKEDFDIVKEEYFEKLNEVYIQYTPTPPNRNNLGVSMEKLDTSFSELQEKYQSVLSAKTDHLLKFNFNIDEEALIGHYKNQYEETVQQLAEFKNLAQLGIAVEIINHELNSMYNQLNTSISNFNKYITDSSEAKRNYKYLKNAFEHLDSKYKSLNPLYRKTRRTKQYVKGSEIKAYLQTFFTEAFNEDQIDLISTSTFDKSETYTFESVLLPVFINIINNAIYWLRSVEKRQILLDYDKSTGSLIICNSGPKIKETNLEKIFELFYTRRPKGRGIGLYLSKDILNTVGMDVEATNDPKYNMLDGASFLIFPKE
jgi:signal transduction histidine kinase